MFRSVSRRSQNGVSSLLRRNSRRTGANSPIVIAGSRDGARRGRASSSNLDLSKRWPWRETTWARRSQLRAW